MRRIEFYVRPVLLHSDGSAEAIEWEDDRKAKVFGLYRRNLDGTSTHVADFHRSMDAIRARGALDRTRIVEEEEVAGS